MFGKTHVARNGPSAQPQAPFGIDPERCGVTVSLLPTFRFVHEPTTVSGALPFVGRENEIESLAERILFSDGGSFLVTGYRGVGKTSFVNQVIGKLREAVVWADPILGRTEIVDIHLAIARPLTPAEMMHHIIRRLHDRLHELGLFRRLDPAVREALLLAYQRTSLNMARTLSESTERSLGVNDASFGAAFLPAALKLNLGAKRSRSSNQQMSFLGYDDKAAEHDIVSITQRLAAGYVQPVSLLRRLGLALRGAQPPRTGIKVVFVFDELDKLEEWTPKDGDEPGKPIIDQILGALKNLLTTSRVSFVFVAGKDLQERWLEDVGRGDSVYESVFSYDKYLPCLWTDVDSICNVLVDRADPGAGYGLEVFDAFKKYLAYVGRGIPRRIIRTFNEFVEWDRDRPALAFTWQDVRRIRFYAGLQELLDERAAVLFGDGPEEAPGSRRDKRRLGVYYLIDWILRRGQEEFTLNDVLRASSRLSAKVALAQEIAPRVAEGVLRILLGAGYVEASSESVTRVIVGDPNAETEKRYRIAPRRLVEMSGQAAEAELDGDLGPASDGFGPGGDRMPASIGHYRIIQVIGRGGMGVVYEAIDDHSGRRVAVKVLADSLALDRSVVARFEREARILASLDHPNVVRLYESGREGGHVYLALELLDGVTLEEVVRRGGPLPIDPALSIALPVAAAAQHVHERGFVRNDIKPSNIMLTASGRVCILDFGVSRPSIPEERTGSPEVTLSGMVIGTPQFMAPEQVAGREVDERADVYSLGVVLYWMLTGRYPIDGENPAQVLQAQASQIPLPPSAHAAVPPDVDGIVLRCLEKDAADRFESMREMAAAMSRAAGNRTPPDLAALVREVREKARRVDAFEQVQTVPFSLSPAGAAAAPGPPPLPVGVAPRPAEPPPLDITRTMAAEGPSTGASPAVPSRAPALPPPPPEPSFDTLLAPGSPRRSPAEAALGGPELVLVRGNPEAVYCQRTYLAGHVYPLPGDTTLGRSAESDIVLRDVSVSRYHTALRREGGAWLVEDLNSGNGTFLGDRRLFGRQPLRDGDLITVGDFVFAFRTGTDRPR